MQRGRSWWNHERLKRFKSTTLKRWGHTLRIIEVHTNVNLQNYWQSWLNCDPWATQIRKFASRSRFKTNGCHRSLPKSGTFRNRHRHHHCHHLHLAIISVIMLMIHQLITSNYYTTYQTIRSWMDEEGVSGWVGKDVTWNRWSSSRKVFMNNRRLKFAAEFRTQHNIIIINIILTNIYLNGRKLKKKSSERYSLLIDTNHGTGDWFFS